MSKTEHVRELQDYERTISEKISGNLHEGIEKMNETVFLLGDIQKICAALQEEVSNQEHQIKALESEKEALELWKKEKQIHIDAMEEKVRVCEKIQLDMATITALNTKLEAREALLKNQQEQLEAEQAAFEKIKEKLLSNTEEAKQTAENRKIEKETALRQRDTAIVELNQVKEELAQLRKKQQETEEKFAQLQKEQEESEDQIFLLQEEKAEYAQALSVAKTCIEQLANENKSLKEQQENK